MGLHTRRTSGALCEGRNDGNGFFEHNDPNRRLMVIANYNHDIGDYWEWSGSDYWPVDLTNEAFKLGVNYVIYGMIH